MNYIIVPGRWQKEYTILKSISPIDNSNLQGLRHICLFIITIYVKVWLKALNSSDAPYNDLCLLQTLESYGAVDKQVTDIAIKKMRGHMWYLREDLIGVALFSDFVLNSEKETMITALKILPMKTDLRRVGSKLVAHFQEKTLSDFVTQRSMNLFTALKIDPIFLTSYMRFLSCLYQCQVKNSKHESQQMTVLIALLS